MTSRFHDRCEAGRKLADRLSHYANRADVLVLALPRGGVPVGCEIARQLVTPLDVLMVHRLASPHQPHDTVGAVASGGVCVIDGAVACVHDISDPALRRAVERAAAELARREHMYRCLLFGPDLYDHTIILVDDGVMSGSTMRAAIEVARRQSPARLVIAVPVVPAEIAASLQQHVDEMVVLAQPTSISGIRDAYELFPVISDDDARRSLEVFVASGGRTTVTCAAMPR